MPALYRTFRPLTFQEVVGQEHVKEPLLRAIREGRLAQAYLFSGPRGVGKTTTARLLAMAVGCQGQKRPCGVCPHCQAVQKGAHPDVVEIDAASNNSVEDVRELRERILLAPLTAPKKVFILDEAHMLSKSAFNALLKTLEEPPPHVLFVFATTEPERMPPTILSRVQHYRFRRLREEEIALKLRRILEEMGREAEEEALLLIARLSDGAMRDAESLLERLLLLEGPLTRTQVEAALGLPPEDQIAEALDRMLAGDLQKGMETFRRLYHEGFSAPTLLRKAIEVLQRGVYEGPPEEALRKLGLAAALEDGLSRVVRMPDLLSLEGAFLQGIYGHLPAQSFPNPPSPKAEEPPLPPPRPRREVYGRKAADREAKRREVPTKAPTPEAPKEPSGEEAVLRGPGLIEAIVANVGERRKFKALLNNALKGEISFDGKTLRILFPPGFSGNAQKVSAHLEEIEAALRKAFGSKLQGKPQIVVGTLEAEAPKGRKTPESQGPPLRPRPRKEGGVSEPPPTADFPASSKGEAERLPAEVAAVHARLRRTFGKVTLLGVRPKRDRLIGEDEGVAEDPTEGYEEG